MHRVILWSKEQLIIDDDKVDAVATAMAKGKPFWLNHKGGKDFIAASAISRITRAVSTDTFGMIDSSVKQIDSGQESSLHATIEATKLKSALPRRALMEAENEQN